MKIDLNICLIDNPTVAIIGLGYVGLPLAIEFGSILNVLGYDINSKRIDELSKHYDRTLEISKKQFLTSKYLKFTNNPKDLARANVFIVTVPTPVDSAKRPDLSLIVTSTKTIASLLKPGDLVIYESTVYPGATEELCVPLLEEYSGLKYNESFFCGYSPERINPGDKERSLSSIMKVTSGSNEYVSEYIDQLYKKIIKAGTFKAKSIKVAEAAKVIENTQRDLNIALMNELSLIFHKMGIDTLDVLEAAGTKWNFLPFRPGLVGGHCIGVDPYYLTHKAQEIGYQPEVILSGRRINDSIGFYIAGRVVKLLLVKGHNIIDENVLVLGLAFKENCPDVRNTKVIDIITELRSYKLNVDVYDPYIDINEANLEYGLDCLKQLPSTPKYSAIILAVAHDQFLKIGMDGYQLLMKPNAVIYDVKGVLPKDSADERL